MLDDHKGHVRLVRGHGGEKSFQGLQPARRCADAYHWEDFFRGMFLWFLNLFGFKRSGLLRRLFLSPGRFLGLGRLFWRRRLVRGQLFRLHRLLGLCVLSLVISLLH